MEAFGYLEVRRGPLLGRGLELAADYLYEVGAGEECHLQLSSEGVAEVHVQLHVHEGRLVLTTLAETRVNGFPVTGSVYLDPGDLLGVAGVEVHYTQERPEPREPIEVVADPLEASLQEQERLRREAVELCGRVGALGGERDELRAE
ncbi:MAG TPA: hypothetical protein DEA08_31155, partial [Planctomycetes bacterium]|nr:hypothetical protein [Planctomycetota bacterium]